MNRSIRKSYSFPRLIASSVAVAAILSLSPHSSRAAPVGGVVASGTATISASGLVTTINQSTDRAVIDWTGFNLAQNETARFVVPSDSGATLNRVSGGLSTISGSVESNGVVYFSNPNGLVFDATSRVMVNGVFATTGTISNFDFMNRGEFSHAGNSQITLNGAISAPAITALAGTVTVGGNLSAGSGKILLSSTNLTTIGSGATISADGGFNNNGGSVIIWSDNHTDFLGRISATGGTNSGNGGFVEVSGKHTLNFSGTVSTLAPNGKTGTLLLDPATIEIVTATPATPTAGVSYIETATLVTALNTTHVTINANAETTTGITPAPTLTTGGTGLITVTNAVVATTGSSSLTLIGSQIILKANLLVLGSLPLNATRASVWQDPTVIMTAPTVSGSSVDGFALSGANQFDAIGTITNSGTAGILVKNAKALTINAGTIDGGRGGVMVLAPNFNLTLGGAVTVKGSYLRVDMGTGGLLSTGNQTLTANGLDVYFTSATAASANSATIAVGSGSFTFVNDKRTMVTVTALDNNTASNTATIGWGTGLGSLTSGTASASGLTVTTTGAAATINNQGVVYGGTVAINGITAAASSGANSLRYIEGIGVAVTVASVFNGSLMLVGNGAGITSGTGSGAIVVNANLTTGGVHDGTSHVTLVQYGSNGSMGITLPASTVTAGGNLTLTQFGKQTVNFAINVNGGELKSGNRVTITQVGSTVADGIFLTSLQVEALEFNLVQSGVAGSSQSGIKLTAVRPVLKGNMTVTQSGSAGQWGIFFDTGVGNTRSRIDGDLFVTQSGTVGFDGIKILNNDFRVKGSIFLEQSGVAGAFGLHLDASSLVAGNSIFVTQSGKSATKGIYLTGSSLTAGGDVSLVQTGTSSTAATDGGIFLVYHAANSKGVALTAGSNRWVSLKTNNSRLVLNGGDDFKVVAGKMRIDIGTSVIDSTAPDATGTTVQVAAPGYRLQASGVETYYTGATTGNLGQLLLGASNFIFVTNNRSTTSQTTIGSATVLPTAVTV
ncbi:MAG: filamentous hemagglutinin N-terminal domain-containing protein, partial [Alphaproteobacteria bacterium]|nr:filamentous hemagglutinin N-terminal domain-containing protein [Alphaproteobacteria bacterium]